MAIDREQRTVGYYDQHADTWVAKHGGSGAESYWKDEQRRFRELLPGGRVLELGVGAGNEAKYFIENGYDYIGIDPSEGLLRIAQEQNPTGRFRLLSVDDLFFPANTFDGFWAAASLIHLPKDRIVGVLKRIGTMHRQGAIGFISVKKGEGEEEEKETGRWFSYYSQTEMESILGRANMIVIEKSTRVTQGKTVWLSFFIKVEK